MFKPEEQEFIREAAEYLENPGWFIRAAALMGDPLEKLQQKLPEKTNQAIAEATRKALEKALSAAIRSIPPDSEGENGSVGQPVDFSQARARANETGLLHTISAAMTGAAGGIFGFASLP